MVIYFNTKNRFKNFSLTMPLVLMGIGLLVLAVFLSGCKKRGEYLLGSLKNENPYSGNETIIFLDDQGDSVIFYGDGRSSYLFESPTSANKNYYYVNERDECKFIEKNNDCQFMINLTTRSESSALMDIIFTQIDEDIGGECSSINYKGIGYRLPLLEHYKDTDLYMDSLNIQNTYYHNVFADSEIIYNVNYGCSDWNKVTCMYYTTSYGLIKLDFEDGSSWELIYIDW